MTTTERIKLSLARRPEELEKARADGAKVVGYFCCNIPEEILLALDLIPIRLGTGGDDRLVEIGGRYISTQNCVFVRQSVGMFAEGKDPYVKNSDLVAIAGTCIQIYRMGEILEYYFKTPIKVLGVPRNFNLHQGEEYFRKELAQFVLDIEEFAGIKITENRLKESIALLNGIRSKIRRIYEVGYNSAAIGWRDIYETVTAGFYLDRKEFSELLDDLLNEVESENPVESDEDKPRIFISGSIIPRNDTKIIDLVEQVGGKIVGDDLCTGLRPSVGLDIKAPTVDAIADAYLARVQCAALPNLNLKEDKRVENLLRSVRESKADGVVYHTLRYCDPFTFKAGETKKLLGREVPFLEIHTEYASSDVEGIRTRLRAFVELLRAQKHVMREVV
jgi:benzoyl-CoA reductase/2-hydroxyglutaryl-CoA dehydratase subunit BcrC/BadD/HgdB